MYWEKIRDCYFYLLQLHGNSYIWLIVSRSGTEGFGFGGKNLSAKVEEEDVPERVRKAVEEFRNNPFYEIDLKRFIERGCE